MATQATLNYWVKIISCSSFLRNNWAKSLRYFEGISVFKINDGGVKKKNIFFWKQKWEGRLEFRNHKACMLYASSNLVRLWTLLLSIDLLSKLSFFLFFFSLTILFLHKKQNIYLARVIGYKPTTYNIAYSFEA